MPYTDMSCDAMVCTRMRSAIVHADSVTVCGSTVGSSVCFRDTRPEAQATLMYIPWLRRSPPLVGLDCEQSRSSKLGNYRCAGLWPRPCHQARAWARGPPSRRLGHGALRATLTLQARHPGAATSLRTLPPMGDLPPRAHHCRRANAGAPRLIHANCPRAMEISQSLIV